MSSWSAWRTNIVSNRASLGHWLTFAVLTAPPAVPATLCWSRQTPLPSLLRAAENVPTPGRDAPPHQKSVSATSSPAPDATNDPATPPVPNYFPLAFPRCYGYLPQPPSELLRADHCKAAKAETMDGTSMPEGGREFPGNVMFRVADWAKDGIEEDEGLYDIIFA